MSFYIRKSIKFGPIRFNISKSGIGISSGVPGARISTGPRGTYINMGRNGVYYRKKIDESIPINRSTPQQSYFEKNAASDGEIPPLTPKN
jgi:DNA polymerase-3 subunit epsilon